MFTDCDSSIEPIKFMYLPIDFYFIAQTCFVLMQFKRTLYIKIYDISAKLILIYTTWFTIKYNNIYAKCEISRILYNHNTM